MEIRLQHFLSKSGFCSRRKGEDLIKKGLVKVNGKIISELGTKVDPDKDKVEANGKLLKIKNDLIYIALNKPQGYLSTCSQGQRKTILDLIDISQRIYPIGRLDKDSTGLLLLTNDGDLHLKLSHPSFDHEKEYIVSVERPITSNFIEQMTNGVIIQNRKTRKAKASQICPKTFKIILKEGRNKQIRRMAEALDNKVITLKRIRIANLKLSNLKQGSWRYLDEQEKKDLFNQVNKKIL